MLNDRGFLNDPKKAEEARLIIRRITDLII